MDVNNAGFVTRISESLGAGEQSVRLIISLFAGYPLAFLYRGAVFGSPTYLQHLFFTVSGLCLGYFNFGVDVIHSLVNIVAIWLLLVTLGGTAISVAIAFILNTGYLTWGYFGVAADEYDISWVTPHCVLTLRLTAVVFDLYDGRKKEEACPPDQQETRIQRVPSLLEMFGQTYYFGGFLVGPQFNMRRYQLFVEGRLDSQTDRPPHNVAESLLRMMAGLGYIVAFQGLTALVFQHQYMLTQEFADLQFLYKCAYILIWGKLAICKYIGCWLVAEGSCILTGLSFNGRDINGNTLWDGCTNVRISQLETLSSFREMVASFNIRTNMWMSKYVFKRLKFMGSRALSQFITLTYLALWHGIFSGYYMNFFLEFLMMNGETELTALIRRVPRLQKHLSQPSLQPVLWAVKKVLVQFFVSYALVSFVHLNWHRYMQVYSTVYYIGHVVFTIPVIYMMLRSVIPHPVKSVVNGTHHQHGDSVVSNGKKSS